MSASQITNNKDKISQYSNCCVAFGSNILSKLGSPLEIVHQAMKEIQTSKFELVLTSNLYETVAYPKGSGPNFINCCAVYKTKLNASETLLHLHSIEKCLGRIRNKRWAPRVIDLDLIYFDGPQKCYYLTLDCKTEHLYLFQCATLIQNGNTQF